MLKIRKGTGKENTLENFLDGKSDHTLQLFQHFVHAYSEIGAITLHPAKTMIGIANSRRRITYVTQLGKDFLHAVFPFKKPYPDNLCFQKIAQVPGDSKQFNHHFRMHTKEDVNAEVRKFIELAYQERS